MDDDEFTLPFEDDGFSLPFDEQGDDQDDGFSLPLQDEYGRDVAEPEPEQESFSTPREMGVQGGLAISRGLLGMSEMARNAVTAKSEEQRRNAPGFAKTFMDSGQAVEAPELESKGLSEQEAAEVNEGFARKAAQDGLKWLSGKFRENMEFYEQSQDPRYLEAAQRIGDAEDAADGTLGKFTAGMKAVVQNPELILPMAGGVAGTAALQLVGGRLGNRIGGGKVGAGAATAIGAADMGQMQADATFEEIMEREQSVFAASERYVSLVRDHGYSEEDAKVRLATELSEVARQDTALSSFIINRIPGVNQVEDMLGGRAIREGREALQGLGARVKDFLQGAAGEGFTEGAEGFMANRIGNQVEQSFDPTQDMKEDEGRIGADVFMGFLFGGAMSAGRQTAEAFQDTPTRDNDFTQDEIDAMNRGVRELENEGDTTDSVPGESGDSDSDGPANDATSDVDTVTDPDPLPTDDAEIVEQAELEPEPDDAEIVEQAELEPEPEVYENLYDDEDGNTYALDEDGEYLLDDDGEYIITDENGIRTNGPEPEVAPTPEPAPEPERVSRTVQEEIDEGRERVKRAFGPSVEQEQSMTDDELELAKLELAMKLSTHSVQDLYAEKYGEKRIDPLPKTAPIEQQRAIQREMQKQSARIEKRTGDDVVEQFEFYAALHKRRTMPIEAQRMLRREIDRLRPRVQEQQESDAYLKRMEELAGLADLNIDEGIEQGSESDIAGRETLDPQETVSEPNTDTTNSATAESGSTDPSTQSTTEGNTNENGSTRNSSEGDTRLNQNEGIAEDDATTSSPSETGQANSDQNGNLEQAGRQRESDGREVSEPESGREVRRVESDAQPEQGRSIQTGQRSNAAKAAKVLQDSRIALALDQATQASNGRIELFDDVSQLDPGIQAEYNNRLAELDGDHELPAFYDSVNDRIYVNPKLIKSQADAQSVVAHEAVHAGLRDQYGNEQAVKKAMIDLIESVGGRRELGKLAEDLGIPVDQYMDNPNWEPRLSDLANLMEEVLAFTAQKRSGAGKLQQLVTAIRDMLGRMGVQVPYLGRGKSEMAVINAMRSAQIAYDSAVKATQYEPTIGDRVTNAVSEPNQRRIIASIRKAHETRQAQERETPDRLRNLVDVTLDPAERADLRRGEDQRLRYLISPRHVYSLWRNSEARQAWNSYVNRKLFPKKIVGEFTVDIKYLTDAEKNADQAAVGYMIRRLNKAINALKITTDADSIQLEQIMNDHLADRVSALIDPKLQKAATLVRSAEVTSENAADYLSGRKVIPAELRSAFAQLNNTAKHSAGDLKVAHAYITGKINPDLPSSLVEPLTAMRYHLDNHSAQILVHVSEQIADRVSKLNPEQHDAYLEFEKWKNDKNPNKPAFDEFGEFKLIPDALLKLDALHDTISGNLGKYLHRSYQAFDDPEWAKSVLKNEPLMLKGIQALKQQRTDEFMEKLGPDGRKKLAEWEQAGGDAHVERYETWRKDNPGVKAPDDIKLKGKKPRGYDAYLESLDDGELRTGIANMLQDAKDKGGMVDLMTNKSTYGSKELSIMMRRQDLSPIVRELLGEYTDPRVNFVKSSNKMANMIAKQAFLNGLAQELTGSVLFHKPPKGSTEFRAKIASKNSNAMDPLDGMRTTEEFRDVLREWTEVPEVSEWLRKYMVFNGAVKLGKTVWNTGTHFANAGSGVLIALLNGTLRPEHLMMSTRMYGADMFGDTPLGRFYAGKNFTVQQLQDLRVEMIRKGVLGDGANSGEVDAMLKDSATSRTTLGDRILDNKVGRGLKATAEVVGRQYQWEDDFFKAAAYFSGLSDNKKAGMDQDAAEIHSAKRTRDLYPTYSLVPPLIQSLRRFPLVGSFVSFSSEMIRTSFNQKKYFEEDARSGDKMRIARRIIGGAVGVSLLQGAALISRLAQGISDEEDETYRQLLPPWSTNGTILYLGLDDNGNMEYVDLSRFDPWSHFRKMWNSAWNGNNVTMSQKLTEFTIAAVEPFLAPEIVADALTDVARNTRYGTSGFDIYNKQTSIGQQIADVGDYIWRGLAPGWALSTDRHIKAANNEVSFSGKQYKSGDEVLANVGVRKGTINLRVAASRQARLLSANIKNSNKIINAEIIDQSTRTEAELEKKFNAAMKARERNYNNMIRLIDGFREMDMPDKLIREQMYGEGVSKRDIRLLMKGRKPEYEMTDVVGEKALTRATESAGNDKQLKRQLENQFEYKKKVVRKLTKQYNRDQ